MAVCASNFAYYASIMLNAFNAHYAKNYASIYTQRKPNVDNCNGGMTSDAGRSNMTTCCDVEGGASYMDTTCSHLQSLSTGTMTI